MQFGKRPSFVSFSRALALAVVAALLMPLSAMAVPEQAIRLNNDGVKALQLGDFKTAINCFESSRRIDPTYALTTSNLAIAYNNYGLKLCNQPSEAIKYFRRALLLDPSNSTTRANMSGVIKLMGKDPNSSSDRAALGRVALNDGDIAAAIHEYGEALKINGGDKNAIEGAIEAWQKALAARPDSADNHVGLGQVYALRGDFSLAKQEYQKAISLSGGSNPLAQRLMENLSTTASLSGQPGRTQGSGGSHSRKVVRDKWALIVGISKFARPEYNLSFADKDAQDFRNFLVNEAHFAPDHVKMLLNEKATRDNIMDAFGDDFLPRVTMDGDLVVIYISTHGTPASKDEGGQNYIVAYDTDREHLFRSGIDMKVLSERIKRAVHTDRALIVMDTCYSGAAARGARGGESAANFNVNEIAQGTGHLVICSSSPDERSWESRDPSIKNGVFTHYLIDALRQNGGRIDIKKAFDYMRGKVQWEVQKNYGASQVPQLGGQWTGEDLILSVPPSEHREFGQK